MDVALQQPATLDDAVMYARTYEQRNAPSATPAPSIPRSTGQPFSKHSGPAAPSSTPSGTASSAASVNDKAATTKRMSPAEIAERRLKGMCFHCDDAFSQGHKQVCKQLFVIEAICDNYEATAPEEITGLTISIHALTGIQLRSGRTMQVHVDINSARLTALLDSGPTHNFVDTEAAAHARIQLGGDLFLSFHLHIFPGFRVPPTFSRNTNPQHRKAQMSKMEPTEVAELLNNAVTNLGFSGCCKICGEPEDEYRRYLICGHSFCMYKYYHIRCLTPKQIASDAQHGKPRWYCPSCLCRVCLSDKDDDQIILCDGCDEGHHLYCLNPPRTSVPEGEWYCPSCTEERANEEKLRAYEQRMLKLHRKDGAILRSEKYYGVDMLLNAAEALSKDEKMVIPQK